MLLHSSRARPSMGRLLVQDCRGRALGAHLNSDVRQVHPVIAIALEVDAKGALKTAGCT